jgi:hypothetical protein
MLGILTVVLLFGPVITLASAGEPALEATGAEAAAYFGSLDAPWARTAMATATLGMIGSLWFFVALGLLLRRLEGEAPWRSTVATLSGALLAAYGLVGSSSTTEAASLHGRGISSAVAEYAFAVGNVGFANVWIALASFSLSCGWLLLSTRALPGWMGWWLVAAGVGLVASRFVAWLSDVWSLPYLLFWLWILLLSIGLLLRGDLLDPEGQRPSRSGGPDPDGARTITSRSRHTSSPDT